MSFLDKLKSLIKVEFNLNAPLIDNRKVIIKDSFKKNTNTKQIDNPAHFDNNNDLVLDIGSMNSQQKESLQTILQEYLQEDNKLLQLETDNLLESLYSYNKKNTDKQILEFFKPIIPTNDLDALEASLYLRDVWKNHGDVWKLKTDIRTSFGARGNYICNLCSAGYFEKFLIPLYNSSKENFGKMYEIIIGKAVLAIFVHGNMPSTEITGQIKTKLETSKKYGIKFIHVHGIGEQNIGKIKECLKKEEKFFGFFEKNLFEKDNILILELLLKQN